MSENNSFELLLEQYRSVYPGLRIMHKKDSYLMKTIDVVLKFLSMGAFQTFMTHYVTTIGLTIYANDRWDEITDSTKMIILSHEMVHVAQSKRYGRLFYMFLYLFVPIPIGYAYYRSKFEMEAYEVTITMASKVYGADYVKSEEYRKGIMNVFTGPEYLWMMLDRKKISDWFDRVLRGIP